MKKLQSTEPINALANLEGLKVISSTSSFFFKGEHIDLRTVGEKLKVDYAIEGSVRKADKGLLNYERRKHGKKHPTHP